MRSSFVINDRTVHKIMLKRCDGIVERLRRDWEQELLEGVAIAWCSEHIKADDGAMLNDSVLLELPPNRQEWVSLMLKLVNRTKAFGLMLVDFQHDQTKIIFESPFGSRSWSMKVERHGDTKVLSRPTILDDVEAIGLLWNKNKATA